MKFNTFVKRLIPKLKAITRKLDRNYPVFDYEDLYQEALFHLWDMYRKKELCDKTDSFILQGCFFFLKNYIRKTYRRLDYCSVSLNNILSDKDDTFECLLSLTNKEEVFCAISANITTGDVEKLLTLKERRIFRLGMCGLSTREIGKAVGISHVMVVRIGKRIRMKCRGFKKEMIVN